jgi:predicted RNA-binding protein YlqC (UPF0109 family)
MKITDFLKEQVEPIVKSFVDKPGEISVDVATSTTSIILQIKAAREDYGKVIGKKGRTIEALKLITSAIKNTHFSSDIRKISIEILDGDVPSFSFSRQN